LTNLVEVLICDPIDAEGVRKLEGAGFTVDVKPIISSEELKRTVSNYDVVIVRSRTKVTKEIIEAGTQLKLIGRVGVGLDNVDLKAAEEKGIKVINTPEAPAEAVAELALGLTLSLARKIPQADHAMKEGKWIKSKLTGWELKGKTLGTVGLGNIGERVAKLAKAFGMNILITKRTPPTPALLKELEAEFVPLSELLKRSDIVTIHIPYTAETRHMIGEKELQLMKKSAYLINTSRGPIIDENALLKALQSEKLKGAALDVYELEPPRDWTLMRLPNVVCTPHIGAETEEAQKTGAILMADKVINFFTKS
jgi:D-3-phosphoglycerate dehydrogenase